MNSTTNDISLSTRRKKIDEIKTKINTIIVVVITSGLAGHVIFIASSMGVG